jgi:hypothetical protein
MIEVRPSEIACNGSADFDTASTADDRSFVLSLGVVDADVALRLVLVPALALVSPFTLLHSLASFSQSLVLWLLGLLVVVLVLVPLLVPTPIFVFVPVSRSRPLALLVSILPHRDLPATASDATRTLRCSYKLGGALIFSFSFSFSFTSTVFNANDPIFITPAAAILCSSGTPHRLALFLASIGRPRSRLFRRWKSSVVSTDVVVVVVVDIVEGGLFTTFSSCPIGVLVLALLLFLPLSVSVVTDTGLTLSTSADPHLDVLTLVSVSVSVPIAASDMIRRLRCSYKLVLDIVLVLVFVVLNAPTRKDPSDAIRSLSSVPHRGSPVSATLRFLAVVVEVVVGVAISILAVCD